MQIKRAALVGHGMERGAQGRHEYLRNDEGGQGVARLGWGMRVFGERGRWGRSGLVCGADLWFVARDARGASSPEQTHGPWLEFAIAALHRAVGELAGRGTKRTFFVGAPMTASESPIPPCDNQS